MGSICCCCLQVDGGGGGGGGAAYKRHFMGISPRKLRFSFLSSLNDSSQVL